MKITQKLKSSPYSQFGKNNIVKMPYEEKQFTNLMKSLSKSQWHFFSEIEKNYPKIHMESQRTPSSQNNLEKEE